MEELFLLYIMRYLLNTIKYFQVRERDTYYYRCMIWQNLNMKICCVWSLHAEMPRSYVTLANATAPANQKL